MNNAVEGLDYKKMYEDMPKETYYTIIPSKVNEEDLFYYITHELSFDKVLGLYILLRTAISTGKLGGDNND